MIELTTMTVRLIGSDPDGIRICHVEGESLTTVVVPRELLSEAKRLPDIPKRGIYYLLDEDHGVIGRVYAGQTTQGLARLDSHKSRKELWNKAVMFLDDESNMDRDVLDALEAGRDRLRPDARLLRDRQPRDTAALREPVQGADRKAPAQEHPLPDGRPRLWPRPHGRCGHCRPCSIPHQEERRRRERALRRAHGEVHGPRGLAGRPLPARPQERRRRGREAGALRGRVWGVHPAGRRGIRQPELGCGVRARGKPERLDRMGRQRRARLSTPPTGGRGKRPDEQAAASRPDLGVGQRDAL